MNRLQLVCSVFLLAVPAVWAEPGGERLLLLSNLEKRTQEISVGVRKPFTVVLVAERDAENPQVSTVAFKLEVPEGIVILGEEQLVQSLVALGTPRAGMHLAFHCVEAKQVPVYSFKMLATKPVERVTVRTVPENKTDFLGIIACRDETFEKWACPTAEFTITAR